MISTTDNADYTDADVAKLAKSSDLFPIREIGAIRGQKLSQS